MTEYKEIPGMPKYKASKSGKIYSDKVHRELKPTINGNGYECVTLYNKGTQKTYGVHQLVAAAFIGHDLNSNKQIDHINNVRTDNRAVNLQIMTSWENNTKENKNPLMGTLKTGKRSWRAGIKIKGKNNHLGTYDCPAAARMAYVSKAHEIGVL